MTIGDLMDQLRDMDKSTTLMLQKPDGTQKNITKISREGDHVTFITDSTV